MAKHAAALCVLATFACAGVSRGGVRQDPCAAAAAGPMQAFDSTSSHRLAGKYRLTIVSDWEDEKGRQVTGSLMLQATDTLHELYERGFTSRGRRTDRRPLWGWAQLQPGNVSLPWGADPTSRDPDHPGVLFHSNGLLELGVWRGLDGSSVSLFVQSISPTGFAGTWDSDLGIAVLVRHGRLLPNPHGHFCALRE